MLRSQMVELIEKHRDQLLALCRKYDVARLDLFGSALRKDFDPSRSDLDFLVEFNNFTIDGAFDRFFGLMVDLEDLFARRIDLVSYQAIQNPFFKQVVDQTRVNLYAA
jgi:predicted nucleotidyltransferase